VVKLRAARRGVRPRGARARAASRFCAQCLRCVLRTADGLDPTRPSGRRGCGARRADPQDWTKAPSTWREIVRLHLRERDRYV